MEVIITGRHVEVTPKLKKYVEGRAKKIEKYTTKATQVTFTLKTEKHRNIAEIALRINGKILKAKEETDDLQASVDLAMVHLEDQLKKQKEKLVAHHPRNGEAHGDLRRLVSKQEAPPEVPKKTASRIKKRQKQTVALLTLEEAESKLQMLDQGFLLFGNKRSLCLNVLYKRADGLLGLIETTYSH
jgi:putative sigma-54 modulation protein